MKKILLGTTALVAAAGFAGVASAQQVTTKATSLSISGSVEFEAAYSDNDAATANRKIDFLSDGDFTFSPKYVADNGLTTTGRIDFAWDPTSSDGNHQSGDLATDELSITFASASFGSLTLGDDDGAVDTFYQQGPLTGDGNWDGSAYRFKGIAWDGDSIEQNLNHDSTKIYYSTSGLDLAGFTFGASYTPKDGNTFDSGAGLTKTTDTYSDLYDFGGVWEGEFSGVSVSAGGAFITGKRDFSTENPTSYNLGGTVGFGALKVGGGYTAMTNASAAGGSFNEWALGATYDIGAFTVGATMDKASYTENAGGEDSTAFLF